MLRGLTTPLGYGYSCRYPQGYYFEDRIERIDMSTIEYTVTGMTCGHCERAVSEEVGRIEGIADVDVSASSGTLVITSALPVDDAQVVAAVEEAGYSAVRA